MIDLFEDQGNNVGTYKTPIKHKRVHKTVCKYKVHSVSSIV